LNVEQALALRGRQRPTRRPGFSRGRFLRGVGGAAGALATAGLWTPALAQSAQPASPGAPRPIPTGLQFFGPGTELFHVFPPASGLENATLTDFVGWVGTADIAGMGAATDTATGQTTQVPWTADMRFMKGTYVAKDGVRREGAFAFV
jgi:hypothetical protein